MSSATEQDGGIAPGSRKAVALGVYWPRSSWDLARSAYLADLDSKPDSPDTFVGWLVRAIEQHVARTSQARAEIAVRLPSTERGGGSSRSHRIGRPVIDSLEEAIVRDRQAARIVTRSGFVLEAVHAAGEETRGRLGRPLPAPPARLSARPPRRQ